MTALLQHLHVKLLRAGLGLAGRGSGVHGNKGTAFSG
jgi:hypothetical protein